VVPGAGALELPADDGVDVPAGAPAEPLLVEEPAESLVDAPVPAAGAGRSSRPARGTALAPSAEGDDVTAELGDGVGADGAGEGCVRADEGKRSAGSVHGLPTSAVEPSACTSGDSPAGVQPARRSTRALAAGKASLRRTDNSLE
jgi:hypothetical protein